MLIGFEGIHAEAVKACETTGVPLYLVSTGPGPLPDGTRPFSELFSATPLDEPGGESRPRSPDDTAVLVYTSGTTGKPKGAELTHFQLYMNSTIAGGLFGVRGDDVVLAVLPFFHVFGLSSVINVFVRYGGCLSIVPRFEPDAVLDALEADRCTVIGGVPTMLHALAQQDITGRDLSALRVAVSGGASLPEDIMRTFEDKYGIEVLEGYGMTETASSCSFNRPGDRKVAVHRQAALGRADAGGRPRRTRRCRRARARRRDLDPRPQRDEGVPRAPRGHRRDAARRVAAHR